MSAGGQELRAFWCRVPSRPNFGDALTPWLVQRLSGQYPRFTLPDDRRHKYFVCGSIAALAGAACTVWGSGLMDNDDLLSPEAQYLAVRGPHTRARALACGADCPEVYGDPALLLPRLLSPCAAPHGQPGLIPHFADQAYLDRSWVRAQGLQLIDIQDDISTVVSAITACGWVLSTSLHGLIVAHAYGVPAVWVQMRPLPSGDGSKFADHLAALGAGAAGPHALAHREPINLTRLERAAWCPSHIDTDALWRSCPFIDHEC
jgi:pyruvyltransferase